MRRVESLDVDGPFLLEPDEREPEHRGPQTRTTAFKHTCRDCGRPLTGRKEWLCADRCWIAVRRARSKLHGATSC
jgi:hypothetical protein